MINSRFLLQYLACYCNFTGRKFCKSLSKSSFLSKAMNVLTNGSTELTNRFKDLNSQCFWQMTKNLKSQFTAIFMSGCTSQDRPSSPESGGGSWSYCWTDASPWSPRMASVLNLGRALCAWDTSDITKRQPARYVKWRPCTYLKFLCLPSDIFIVLFPFLCLIFT